jgi:hypothetical protein
MYSWSLLTSNDASRSQACVPSRLTVPAISVRAFCQRPGLISCHLKTRYDAPSIHDRYAVYWERIFLKRNIFASKGMFRYEHIDITGIWNVKRLRFAWLERWSGFYIDTYHSRFIPEGVAEVSQIFLRDTHVLLKLVSYEEHCGHDRW